MFGAWALVDPTDAALGDGLARLREVRRDALATGAAHAGWKVGFNNGDIQQTLGIPTGVVGFLTESTRSRSGRIGIPDSGAAVEVEIAFHLGGSVAQTTDDQNALAAVKSIAVAFEVVVPGDLDITDALGRDVWHHGYVLGDPIPWSSDTLEAIEITLAHGNNLVEVPPPSSGALADVASMLRFTASGAEAIGGSLGDGDVILSGSLAPGLVWVAPGDALSASSDALGALELTLTRL